MTSEQILEMARALASEMKEPNAYPAEDLRTRFIAVRTELYRRGVFDPVLARFDTATVAKASPAEVAEHLEATAASLSR
jgi:hypothetical protein